jgi:acyl-CoA synthetase (NDP forming)
MNTSTSVPSGFASLSTLLEPQSIAIVGAANDWRRFGGKPLHYLRQAGYTGGLFPVNPTRTEVQGVPAYASIGDIGRPVDCAMLAVSAEDTVQTIRDCAAAGVRSAIVFGAGFAEVGAQGMARQAEMMAIARSAGMRILGPNCMGLVNAHAGVYSTFASAYEEGLPAPSGVAIATQSGGYGGYLLKHCFMRGLGVSHFAATGNEADVDVGEVLAWMAQRDEVKVLLSYLEGVRSGPNLVRALEIARANRKPVVVMKVGRTPEGREAASSHTASLTGEDAVYDTLFCEYGVWRARTTDELLDVADALSRGKRPRGPRTAVVSISGGVGVQMADFLADAKLELAEVPQQTQADLRAIVPHCAPANPIDMTGVVTADHALLGRALECVLAGDAFDAVILFLGIVGMAPSMAGPLSSILSEVCARHPDRLLLVSVTTPPELRAPYANAGCLVYEDPSRAVTALAALHHFQQFFDRPVVTPAPRSFPDGLVPRGAASFNEVQAKRILAACGIRSPKEVVVQDAAAAAVAAQTIGFPVAVKIVSADILHKTEHGGVALNLGDAEAVAQAVSRMGERIARELPQARIEGYLVSEMVRGGTECILGVSRDPTFGPVVTFGLGGVAVELLRDVVSRLAPVSPTQAREMMQALRTWPLLSGWRGAPSGDVDALAEAISALSHLAVAEQHSIAEVEVNPLVVLPTPRGVVALDAVIRPAHEGQRL